MFSIITIEFLQDPEVLYILYELPSRASIQLISASPYISIVQFSACNTFIDKKEKSMLKKETL